MQKCQSAIEHEVCRSAHQRSAHIHVQCGALVMAWRGRQSADCQLAMTQHRLQTTARRDGTPRPSRIAAYLAGWRAARSAHRPTDRHYQVSGPAPRATPLVTRSLARSANAAQGRARPPTDGRTNGRCQLAGRREFSASRLLDCTSVKSVSGRSVCAPAVVPAFSI